MYQEIYLRKQTIIKQNLFKNMLAYVLFWELNNIKSSGIKFRYKKVWDKHVNLLELFFKENVDSKNNYCILEVRIYKVLKPISKEIE